VAEATTAATVEEDEDALTTAAGPADDGGVEFELDDVDDIDDGFDMGERRIVGE
jgi:hypothetical protein